MKTSKRNGIRSHKERKPLKICVVAKDLLGWGDSTESAASMSAIAQNLASAGDQVTILWSPGYDSVNDSELEKLQKYYFDNYLVNLDIVTASKELLPNINFPEKQSAAIYFYIKNAQYDAVIFALEGGLAYYSLLGKETGMLDPRPHLIVVGHSPLTWIGEADKFFLRHMQHVSVAHMEKYCVEMADRFICTSSSLLDWIKAKSWELPERIDVLPALAPAEERLVHFDHLTEHSEDNVEIRNVRELVLLAGPDYRDGLTLFCDAMDKLSGKGLSELKVTAFGPFGQILGEHTGGMLLRRARRWPFELHLIAQADFRKRLEYMKARRALAVIPSVASATGRWVSASMNSGIQFIATNAGANSECVPTEMRKSVLVPPNAKSLADAIAIAVTTVSVRPAISNYDARRESWMRLLEEACQPAKEKRTTARKAKAPLVSIVMVHHDRPKYLLQAISAVEQQDYENLELILVDDGSKDSESHDALDRLAPTFKKNGWNILRQENKYLGAARNAGVRAARGDLILFVDDDNALFTEAVSKYVKAMDASGADICTAFHRAFYEEFVPVSEQRGYVQYLAPGGSLDLGLIVDSFGDANAMIRRSVFDKIGYQIEDYGYTAHDWEFFARAVLAGLKLRIIPEPLYWYRSSAQGMYHSSHWYDNRLPILSAFKKHDFKGLEYVYHMVLAANVSSYDTEMFRNNLSFSPSDERFLQLCKLDPNSKEAIELLAEIAASEGRPDTALVLLGRAKGTDFASRVTERLSVKPLAETALREFAAGFIIERPLAHRDLMRLESVSANPETDQPLSYVEQPDRYFLQAKGGAISVAVLPAGVPAAAVGVTFKASLEQAVSEPAEFLVMLAPFHVDPVVAVESAKVEPSDGSSGWCSVSHPNSARQLEAVFQVPSAKPMNLVLAVRSKKPGLKSVLGCFSAITVRVALGDRASRRPRIGPPPTRLRAREWTDDERRTIRLITPYASELPLLLLPPQGEGVFLRPHVKGPVVASMEWGFPPFARRLVGQVEIAHDAASPFEFAVALTRPTEPVVWKGERPNNCLAFSGWVRVGETFKLHEVALEISELTKTHLSINLAIRLPRGSSPSPANAFWRKIIFAWDE